MGGRHNSTHNRDQFEDTCNCPSEKTRNTEQTRTTVVGQEIELAEPGDGTWEPGSSVTVVQLRAGGLVEEGAQCGKRRARGARTP